MGQQPSKHHSLLAFGYVNHNDTPPPLPPKDLTSLPPSPPSDRLPDYVLNHPELYKLELTCHCTMTPKHRNTRDEEWIVATQRQECRTCRQNKRMSLVRNHLAKDLEYIDETYYSGDGSGSTVKAATATATARLGSRTVLSWKRNSVLGNNGTDIDDDSEEEEDDQIDESWAKITIGEATSQTSRNSVGGNENHGSTFTSLGARLTSTPSTSFTLNLSDRSLVKLSAGIGYLGNLTKLNLSNNQLSSLPKSIGYLQNLSVLNASNNHLDTLPDTLVYLTKLKAINVSHNKLAHLPASLGSLPNLVIIIANNNRIHQVPKQIAKLQQLVSFNISHNPVKQLPAELITIKSLRKLIAEGCDFCTEFVSERSHDPPSLFEQCARTIVRHQLALPDILPDPLRTYLLTHQECSYCDGPYFESYVTRGRFIERAHQPIALEYRLCCAHWTDESDRLLNLFSKGTETNAGPSFSSPLPDTIESDTPSTNCSRKRSASNSSALSSYRRFPLLPPLPSLDACSGAASSSSSAISDPPPCSRSRTNSSTSITKRFAHYLAPPKSNMDGSLPPPPLPEHHVFSLPGDNGQSSSARYDKTTALPPLPTTLPGNMGHHQLHIALTQQVPLTTTPA